MSKENNNNETIPFILYKTCFLSFSRLIVEQTDPTMARNSLTLNFERINEVRKSQTSLLSAMSDDTSLQMIDVSNQ